MVVYYYSNISHMKGGIELSLNERLLSREAELYKNIHELHDILMSIAKSDDHPEYSSKDALPDVWRLHFITGAIKEAADVARLEHQVDIEEIDSDKFDLDDTLD